MKQCKKCGNSYDEGVKFCPSCGTPSEQEPPVSATFCVQCGAKIATDTKFCPSCGSPVGDNLPAAKSTEKTLSASMATLEVYRESSFLGLINGCSIYLDNEKIGQVSNGKKRQFEVSPGIHEIRVKFNWSPARSDPMNFTIASGEFKRIRSRIDAGFFSLITGMAFFKTMFGSIVKLEEY